MLGPDASTGAISRTGRIIVPPLAVLRSNYDEKRSQLAECITQCSAATVEEADNIKLEQIKTSLSHSYKCCKEASIALRASLDKDRLVNELARVQKDYAIIKSQAKDLANVVTQREHALLGSSAPNACCVSTVPSQAPAPDRDDLQSMVRGAQQRIQAELEWSKLDIEEKIVELESETKKKVLKLRQEKENLIRKQKLDAVTQVLDASGAPSVGSLLGVTGAPSNTAKLRAQDWLEAGAPKLSELRHRPMGHMTSKTLFDEDLDEVISYPVLSEDTAARDTLLPRTSLQNIDPATRFLLISELKKTPSTQFGGEPHLFNRWIQSLLNRMQPLNLTPLDQLDIFEAHTTGAARELVQTLGSIVGSDPGDAVDSVVAELRRRFGSTLEVANSLLKRLYSFPDIKGNEADTTVAMKLRQLSDLCLVIVSNMESSPDLQFLNFATGLKPVRTKLPQFVNNDWRRVKSQYELKCGRHPEFRRFSEFLKAKADLLCDDQQVFSAAATAQSTPLWPPQNSMKTARTLQTQGDVTDPPEYCVLHRLESHTIKDCSAFAALDSKTRRLFAHSHQLCVRCLRCHEGGCTTSMYCDICGKDNHLTIMHMDKMSTGVGQAVSPRQQESRPGEGKTPLRYSRMGARVGDRTFFRRSAGPPGQSGPRGEVDPRHRALQTLRLGSGENVSQSDTAFQDLQQNVASEKKAESPTKTD